MTTTLRLPNPGPVQILSARAGAHSAAARRAWELTPQAVEFTLQTVSAHLVPAVLRDGRREWRFGAATEWFRIGLINKGTKLFSHEIAPQSFTNESVTIAGTTVSCSWSVIAGDTSSVTATWTFAGGELRCTAFTATIDAAGTGATYAIGYVERGRFWHESPAADADKLVGVLPAWTGRTIPDATAVPAAEHRASYPGQHLPYPEAELGDAGIESAHGQYLGLVHTRATTGMLHYALDTEGRAKVLRCTGDGADHALTAIREYPANNLEAMTWTPSYQVRLKLFDGDEWAAANLYGEAMRAAAPPWITGRGHLKDNGTSPRPVPTWVHEADTVLWLLFVNQGHTPVDAARRMRLQEEVTRWNTIYSSVNRCVWLQLTHWTGSPVEGFPDIAPIYAEAATLIDWLRNTMNLNVAVYVGCWWGDSTTWLASGYNPGFGDPNLVSAHDKAGANALMDVRGNGTEMALFPDWGLANARNHTTEIIATAMSEAVGAKAIYFDGVAGSYHFSYRATLGVTERGPSAHPTTGLRAMLTAARSAIQAAEAAGSLWLEHFQEPALDHGDVFLQASERVAYLDLTNRWTPLVASAWGGWAHILAINAYGTFDSSVGVDYYEALRLSGALNVVAGRIPMLATMNFVSDPTTNHLVLQAGDADWAAHGAVNLGYHGYFLNLCRLRRNARTYFRGQMLRPPPGSFFEALRDDGWGWTTTEDGLFVRPTRASGVMAVWTHTEDADEPLGIVLVNPLAVEQTFTVTLDPTWYHMVGHRTVYRNDDGVRTELQTFAGVCQISFTVPAFGAQLLEVGA